MIRDANSSPDHGHLTTSQDQPKKKYGCLMAILPDPITKQITEWIPSYVQESHLAKSGWEGSPHVTIKYGFEDDIGKELPDALGMFGPFTLKLLTPSLFKGNEDGDVWKLDVASPYLHDMNRYVSRVFRCYDKYPDYRPHLTLAYLDPRYSASYTAAKPPFLNLLVTIDTLEYSTADKRRMRIKLGESRKALSWLNVGSGGALVKPPAFPKVPKVEESLFRAKSLDWMTKAGFTGQKEDKLGRKICYESGKRVACPKPEKKPAGDATKQPEQKPKKEPKPKPENKPREDGRERGPNKGETSKPSDTPKPRTKPKTPAPSVQEVTSRLNEFLGSGQVTPESVREVSSVIGSLTVAKINELKKAMGLKASGTKQKLADNLAAQIVAKVKPKGQGIPKEKPKEEQPDKSPAESNPWPKDEEIRRLNATSEAELTKLTDGVTSKLDEMDKTILRSYTDNNFERLNAIARGEVQDVIAADQQMVDILDQTIRSAPPLPPNTMAYRGISLPKGKQQEMMEKFARAVKNGSPITLGGFTSTSLDPGEAVKFSFKGDSPLMFEIRASNGLYMEPITHNQGEKELLLPNNSRFRVVGIAESPTQTKDGTQKVRYVQLEQIPEGQS